MANSVDLYVSGLVDIELVKARITRFLLSSEISEGLISSQMNCSVYKEAFLMSIDAL